MYPVNAAPPHETGGQVIQRSTPVYPVGVNPSGDHGRVPPIPDEYYRNLTPPVDPNLPEGTPITEVIYGDPRNQNAQIENPLTQSIVLNAPILQPDGPQHPPAPVQRMMTSQFVPPEQDNYQNPQYDVRTRESINPPNDLEGRTQRRPKPRPRRPLEDKKYGKST